MSDNAEKSNEEEVDTEDQRSTPTVSYLYF